jgi:DNA-binding NarL/FixJ family response regulator
MSGRPLRVLLLEDNAADTELLAAELAKSGFACLTMRVETDESFKSALREFAPDVVLSDHSLAQFNAVDALSVLRQLRPTAALIVVAGALNERVAVECMRAGAEDLVLKENLSRLGPAIAAALAARESLERLSPRQLEVLGLVAEGLTTRQIARRLKLSAKTVETHRGEIMKRLGIHDVVGLVRLAVRLGLVPPEK